MQNLFIPSATKLRPQAGCRMREVLLESREDRQHVYLPEKCIGCGTCVQICPKGELVIGSVGAVARGLIDKDFIEKRKKRRMRLLCSVRPRLPHWCPGGQDGGQGREGRLLSQRGSAGNDCKREMRPLRPVRRCLPAGLHRDKRPAPGRRRQPEDGRQRPSSTSTAACTAAGAPRSALWVPYLSRSPLQASSPGTTTSARPAEPAFTPAPPMLSSIRNGGRARSWRR